MSIDHSTRYNHIHKLLESSDRLRKYRFCYTLGYMKELLPENAPTEGEEWSAIFSDVEKVIMPGVRTAQSNF